MEMQKYGAKLHELIEGIMNNNAVCVDSLNIVGNIDFIMFDNNILSAYIFGNFGTLYAEFTIAKGEKGSLASLKIDISKCWIDIAEEGQQMPDRKPATAIPETDSTEKIQSILWANVYEWKNNGTAFDKQTVSIINHYYSSGMDVKRLEYKLYEKSMVRQQKQMISISHQLKGVKNLFAGCEKDFNNLPIF